MCVSGDRVRDTFVNTKPLVLYICTTILMEKIIPFCRSNLFSFMFLIFLTRILYSFITTKTIQIYLYIGVIFHGNILKIFSLPTHLSYIKLMYLYVYIPFKECKSAITHVDARLQWCLCLFVFSVMSFSIDQFVQ